MFGLFKKSAPVPKKSPARSTRPAREIDPEHQRFCQTAGVDLGFAEVLRLTQMTLRAPEPLTPEQTESDAELAQRILDRVEKDRPGPNSFPSSSLRVLNLVAQEEPDLNELIKAVRQDAALCASLLKVVNSAANRGLNEVESMREAVTRIGLKEVGRVAGIMSARTLFNPQVKAEFTLFGPLWHQLFRDASVVAWGASGLAMRHAGASADRTFLGGLLHDVGKSVALRALAQEVLSSGLPQPRDLRQVERVLHAVHIPVGQRVHETWSLPEGIKPICHLHHEEHLAATKENVDVLVVRVVSALRTLSGGGELVLRAAHEVWSGSQALQLGPHAVRALHTEMKRHHEQVDQISKKS